MSLTLSITRLNASLSVCPTPEAILNNSPSIFFATAAETGFLTSKINNDYLIYNIDAVTYPDDIDKINAFKTLHEVLIEFNKAMAPVLPFICEKIYLRTDFYL